jgi:multiple sugar transport system permease protein
MADQRIEPILAERASPAAPAAAPGAVAIPEARRMTRLGRLLEQENVLAGVLLTPTLVILALFIAYPFFLGIWLAVSD